MMAFDKILTSLENAAISVTFFILTILAFINVVSRYVLHGSLDWSSELISGLAVYMIMIGTSAAIRIGAHPDFTLLRDATRGPLRVVIVIVTGIAMTGLMLTLLWLGMHLVENQQSQGRTTPALGVAQWILSLAIPVGAVFGIIRSIQMCIRSIRRPGLHTETVNLIQAG